MVKFTVNITTDLTKLKAPDIINEFSDNTRAYHEKRAFIFY